MVKGQPPAEVRRSAELWVGCIAGALEEDDYRQKLRAAGFTDIDVETWRVYDLDDARAFLAETGLDVETLAPQVKRMFASAFVRATKPAAKSCCGPDCCAAK